MKKISIVLVLILLSSFIGCALPSVAFAQENAVKLDDTYVLDDLKGAVIDNVIFNTDNYPYSSERTLSVLAFAEYGYGYSKDKQDNYALYVYVYNPSGKEIASERNKVGIATVYANDKPVDYDKFELRLLSVSNDQYANLFYKFRIADASKILTRVSENSNSRRYDVSEIELNFGGTNCQAFNVGNYYLYSGFAKGYGADSSAESSLSCKSDSIETLKLDVNSTFYRYYNNVKTQSDLSSVYFGVPNTVLERYGTLQQIKANWFETQTQTIPVFYDKKIYDYLRPYVGISTETQTIDLSKITLENGSNVNEIFNLCLLEPAAVGYEGYNIIGNKTFNGKANLAQSYAYNKFRWMFYAKDGKVPANEVLAFANEYSQKFNDNLLIGKYAEELFIHDVDYGRKYGWQGDDGSGVVIDADCKLKLDGFSSTDKLYEWFEKLRYPDLEGDDINNIVPIYIVQDSDLEGDNAAIAKRLLIDEKEVAAFVATYKKNQVAGRKTVLFRFALTKYNTWGEFRASTPGIFEDNPIIGYSCSQTAFLDFDVIWLKFVNEGVETVIPTVSNPKDIVSGDLTPPLEPNDTIGWLQSFVKWLEQNWWIFVVIGVLLILAILAPFIPLIASGFKIVGKGIVVVFKYLGKGLWFLLKYLFIGLFYIVSSPYWLIRAIVIAIKKRKGE